MSETPSNEATIFNAARKIKSSKDQAAYLKTHAATWPNPLKPGYPTEVI